MAVIFALAVLTACKTSPAATPAAAASPTAAVASPTPTTAGPTAAATPTGSRYSQQYEITEKDSGKTFVYTLTTRFQLILDQGSYPKESLKVNCSPDGVLGSISNIPPVAPPLYAVRYEGAQPGTCTFTDRAFAITVQIATQP